MDVIQIHTVSTANETDANQSYVHRTFISHFKLKESALAIAFCNSMNALCDSSLNLLL